MCNVYPELVVLDFIFAILIFCCITSATTLLLCFVHHVVSSLSLARYDYYSKPTVGLEKVSVSSNLLKMTAYYRWLETLS